ncbi:MAG: cysteine--tRNA ligase [Chromatiales bacterium]|nr:cysteine--tRNA ligase [Gammaproteobacteria bacterium]MBW6476716.1 cysteine--tRNA ligase [Chromatiales bacterium]
MAYRHNLKVHNNLSKQKESFIPIDPTRVRMYVCGMTVYDYCHIGHARVLVVFDVVNRYLRRIFGDDKVTYVRNITDIDDKIIARANQNAEGIDSLTERYIALMNEDADRLGVRRPDLEPRATRYMAEIIEMVQALIARGYAYAAANGDVYYDVSRFEGYGKLSGKNPEDLRAGERVAVDEAKQDPLDFVLWKAAKPGEPSWDSPWGTGRPGWHIECSAMSTKTLGEHFDIHGGGLDLQFPHHENEIAQSEGACGCTFVNYWLHNGFVRVDNEKMSKSLGNFFTIREVMARYDPEVIRLFILSSHYRSPLNYSDQHLDNAKAALGSLYNALRGLTPASAAQLSAYSERFLAAMDDDFATPDAIAVLFELAHEIHRCRAEDANKAALLAAELRELAALLGLLQQDPDAYFKGGAQAGQLDAAAIDTLIAQRLQARQDKDWAESDRIRDLLKADGVLLEDGPQGTIWRRES